MRILVALMALMFSGPALCGDTKLPIPRPKAPTAIDGQCARNFGINKGRSLPPLVLNGGVAACSAVGVPLSDHADLLATEKWAEALAARYLLDVAELTHERDWYKAKLEKELEPVPWLERPSTQRWFGRLETLVTVGVVAAGLGAAYQYGSGGFK